ncbi:MFS transporter [Halioxenophilus sp. WMMB6]|uniref:spinster family MFS transporter n=1 Tax=Halioxenophilus sp. WMMB6 TaxID=3073815 RepID=UPI00295F2BA4|nr:MFS transporter [Halioxenophilus sp. WMMB6]
MNHSLHPEAAVQITASRRLYSVYVLAILFTINIFNVMDRKLISTILPDIQKEFSVSDTQLGLLTGFAFAAFYLLAGVPVARWADVGCRRNIIGLGLLVWSLMTTLSGYAQSFMHLLLLRVGVAVGEAGGGPPAHSLVADYFPQKRRATALSIYGLGGSLGAILGLMVGGYVATHYGWRTAFIALGLPGVLFVLVIFLTVREPQRGATDTVKTQVAANEASFLAVCRYLLKLPSFRFLIIAASLTMFAQFGVNMWDVTFLRRVHGVTAEQAGGALGLIHLFAMFSVLIGAVVSDKLGQRDVRYYMWLPAVGGLLCVPFNLGFIMLDNYRLVIASGAVGLVLGGWWMGAALATVQNLAKPHMRAVAAALFTLTYNIVGMGIGPSAVGWISDLLTPSYGDLAIRYAFLVSIVPLALAALFFYLAAGNLQQDLAKRDAST